MRKARPPFVTASLRRSLHPEEEDNPEDSPDGGDEEGVPSDLPHEFAHPMHEASSLSIG
jgi:hypothetical protein